MSQEECEEGQQSQFMAFIKSISSFKGDLAQLTCPSFLLSGVSMLEYSVHWADHPELLAKIPLETNPERRMVAVLRWFISTLYGSFYSRCKSGTEKKPFNPILGEQFCCYWDATEEYPKTEIICEQVSHHPPISAFMIKLNQKPIVYGHCGQQTKFKTTFLSVEQTGKTTVQLENDEYVISLPELAVRGFLSGSMFIELLGTSTIESKHGLKTEIEYIPKPWFGGEYHGFKGTIQNTNYTFEGNWTKTSMINDEVLFDAKNEIREPVVPSLEEQDENQSRKIWFQVAQCLKQKNYSEASKLKTQLEKKQRDLRATRLKENIKWEPKYFDADFKIKC